MITRNKLMDIISNAEVKPVNISEIIFDKSLYSRTGGIDRNAVEDYSKNIITMPPIVINQNNKIVDGVHRYHACLKADQQSMNV